MAAWLDAIMSPLSTAGQTVEKLMEVRDLVKFGDTFRKLFAEILAAQKGALLAQQREAELLNRIGALEKEVTRLETWEREKQRYELRNVGWGAYAYILKKTERGTEPPHWACTKCYEDGKIRTLQYGRFEKGTGPYWRCPDCKNDIDPGVANAKWPDDDKG
jgi:rubrerythrin